VKYTIADKEGYIRADLLERQDAEETEAFRKAIGVERREHQRKAVLICVHTTRAVFRVEKYHASRFWRRSPPCATSVWRSFRAIWNRSPARSAG